jgi:hypothetical protein
VVTDGIISRSSGEIGIDRSFTSIRRQSTKETDPYSSFLSLWDAGCDLPFGGLYHVAVDFGQVGKSLENLNANLFLGKLVVNGISNKEHVPEVRQACQLVEFVPGLDGIV